MARLLSHSSSDDQRKYRTKEELAEECKKDPIINFENICIDATIITTEQCEEIKNKVHAEINDDAEWAEEQDHPERDTA